MKQAWHKSWALWMSIAALIVYVCKTVCKIDIEDWVNGLMDVLLPVMIGFGLINNPNEKTRWVGHKDD